MCVPHAALVDPYLGHSTSIPTLGKERDVACPWKLPTRTPFSACGIGNREVSSDSDSSAIKRSSSKVVAVVGAAVVVVLLVIL